MSMLIWDELGSRREKQLKAVMEGLRVIELLPFVERYGDSMYPIFVSKPQKLDAARMKSLISWESLDENDEQKQWLQELIENCDTDHLVMLLKFSTGLSMLGPINQPEIVLSVTSPEKLLPEAIVCARTLCIPVGNKTKEEFFSRMNTALECGYEGYGNL